MKLRTWRWYTSLLGNLFGGVGVESHVMAIRLIEFWSVSIFHGLCLIELFYWSPRLWGLCSKCFAGWLQVLILWIAVIWALDVCVYFYRYNVWEHFCCKRVNDGAWPIGMCFGLWLVWSGVCFIHCMIVMIRYAFKAFHYPCNVRSTRLSLLLHLLLVSHIFCDSCQNLSML